jgi:hypothetical protein
MSAQPQLFYEDIYEVVRAAMQSAGGAKVVAGRLWPNTPIGEAQRTLLDCLNRDRPQKLDLDDLLAILRMAKDAGFHQSKHWLDEATGYRPSDPMDPRIERDRLAESFNNLAEAVKNAQRAMERLTVEPNVRAVK